MVSLTAKAIDKVKEIMATQTPTPVALRVGVAGGGCSGFMYRMEFADAIKETDQVVELDGLKVAVDQMSAMYLEGTEIDFIETLPETGFKFNNPNITRSCGCGNSFSV